MYKILLPFLFSILLFTSGCKQTKAIPVKSFSNLEIKKIDETYHHYRENFFKYFLDEGKNRFNGCVPERIYVKPEKLLEVNYLEGFNKIKFADATIYASMALMFLSNDVSFQLSQGNKAEAIRSGLLLRQVMDGIISNDKLSTAGIDGFFLRDTVGNMEGFTIESDFLNTAKGDNEMSGSQSSALYYGFHFSLFTLSKIDGNEVEGIDKITFDIKNELSLLTKYLSKNKFKIQSEIHPGKKVKRGFYTVTLKWMYTEINRYWNDKSNKNSNCKLIWTLMYKGTNWLCKIKPLSVKNYNKLKVESPKNYHGKTYAPFYVQMLQTALISMKPNSCDQKNWDKYVWRYQNGFAVSTAVASGLPIRSKYINMTLNQLLDAPSNHLPNSFSKDHQGWNEDNRWVRLLHRNKILDKVDEVKVYNGLDFLCVYIAMRNQLKETK